MIGTNTPDTLDNYENQVLQELDSVLSPEEIYSIKDKDTRLRILQIEIQFCYDTIQYTPHECAAKILRRYDIVPERELERICVLGYN